MAILRDYYCENHGIFEAWEAECPMKMCKGAISVVHLKPVGTRSARTKKADESLKGLAQDFQMTDIKSTRAGEHQTGYLTRNNELDQKQLDFVAGAEAEKERQILEKGPKMPAPPREARPGDAAMWGSQGGISMNSVMGGQFKPVRDEAVSILPHQASPTGKLNGPIAGNGSMNDHQNLQVDK